MPNFDKNAFLEKARKDIPALTDNFLLRTQRPFSRQQLNLMTRIAANAALHRPRPPIWGEFIQAFIVMEIAREIARKYGVSHQTKSGKSKYNATKMELRRMVIEYLRSDPEKVAAFTKAAQSVFFTRFFQRLRFANRKKQPITRLRVKRRAKA